MYRHGDGSSESRVNKESGGGFWQLLALPTVGGRSCDLDKYI
jgi:hypothetical protein